MAAAGASPEDQAPTMSERVDYAWRCHNAQESWTAKVDTKASILLTVNLVGIAALLAERNETTRENGAALALGAGTLTLGLAALVSIAAIFPLLGRRLATNEQGIIYFGHLRQKDSAAVARQISELSYEAEIDQLARQLVAMARANWIKHRTFQIAVLLSAVAYSLAGLALVS
jgi:hypothetical protein